MALEPEMPSLDNDDNPELRDFSRRFWWTLPLTASVTVLAMFGHRLGWFERGERQCSPALRSRSFGTSGRIGDRPQGEWAGIEIHL